MPGEGAIPTVSLIRSTWGNVLMTRVVASFGLGGTDGALVIDLARFKKVSSSFIRRCMKWLLT